ncbi:MAG: hypothetical protein LAT81_13465 [Oceanicaulis sp.]|nr:hypothetical protein [Oceanicaulis sp.]
MTPNQRQQKQFVMRALFESACESLKQGKSAASARAMIRLDGMTSAFHELDPELFKYGIHLSVLYDELCAQGDTRDRNIRATREP